MDDVLASLICSADCVSSVAFPVSFVAFCFTYFFVFCGTCMFRNKCIVQYQTVTGAM